VLKGSSLMPAIPAAVLCVTLAPLGVAVLRAPPAPRLQILAALSGGMLYLGRLG
jgi:hypothetical protein